MIASVITILVALCGACRLDLHLTRLYMCKPYLYLYMKVFLLSVDFCSYKAYHMRCKTLLELDNKVNNTKYKSSRAFLSTTGTYVYVYV